MKLVVGIDPGITAALAFLDAESDYYKTVSKRNFSFSEICEAIAEEGDPIVIASDTEHVPQLVKKITATFGCRLFSPKRDLMVGEKKFLTENLDYKNDHERDALASALHAKHEFAHLFEKVDYYLENKGLRQLAGDVKELLVKSEAANIEQAVKMLSGQEKKETKIISKIIESKKVLELREKIRRLEKGKNILEQHVEHLEDENRKLERELERKPKQNDLKAKILERIIAELRKENEALTNEIEQYKNLLEKDLSEKNFEIVYPYKEGEDFSGRAVMASGKEIKGLGKQKPKAIICDEGDIIRETDVPLIHKDKINIQRMGNFLVVDKNELEKAIQQAFVVWLARYKERYAKA